MTLLPFAIALPVSAQTPANDNFVDAIPLAGTNISTTGINLNATKEPGEPDHAGNLGGKSIWWSWQAPQSGYVTISTEGSSSSVWLGYSLDTILGVYVGSSVSTLTEVASNDEGPIDSTSQVKFKVTGGTTYRIAVDGYNYFDSPPEADEGGVMLSLNFSSGLPVAPEWALPSIDGTTIRSTNFLGKVMLLNFWATWCGPCIAETPDLVTLQQNYSPDGLVVIGISVDQSPDGVNPPMSLVQSFAASYQINYPIVMSRPYGWNVETLYGGIPYIPSTFVIDRKNHIVETFVGTQTYATFEGAIKPLLYADLRIAASVQNGLLHVSWPMTQAPFGLETTTNFTSGIWTDFPATAQSDGSTYYVNLPLDTADRFFRLRSQ